MTLATNPLMPSLMDYLEADATLDEVLDGALFPVSADQGHPGPWIAFRLKKTVRDYAVDGPSELNMADVEFKIASPDYGQAHGIAKQLLYVLDGYRGVMGDIVVTHMLFMDSRDGEIKDEVLGLYHVICEVNIWYTDA